MAGDIETGIPMGMGWYGPLIDLSQASSHVGNFVQLLVFVHRSNPVEYKLAKGGTVIRSDIHVGDDTRPFFSVSLWNNKYLASSVSAGDIILFKNVKVVQFGNMVEAKTVMYSSLVSLIHPYNSLLSKDADELISSCRVGETAKKKLRRVIEWVQRSRSTLCYEAKGGGQGQAVRNWKEHEELPSLTCSSLSEALQLSSSCKVIFNASVGEIFLHSAWNEIEQERMFISRRLSSRIDNIVEDIICTGCQLCGSPLSSGSTRTDQKAGPLYCKKSSSRLHTVGKVYRPFLLYVWDGTDYIPLLITNKAAELLFGNIKAEKVHQSYLAQKNQPSLENLLKGAANKHEHKTAGREATESCSSVTCRRSGMDEQKHTNKDLNFYMIWLILLKVLLVQGKNSPLKFEALVNPSLEMEDGKFEMTGMSMPCSETSHVLFLET